MAATVEQLFDRSAKDLREWDDVLHIDLVFEYLGVYVSCTVTASYYWCLFIYTGR